MVNWFVRMKPKLKNWRWWILCPLLVVYALVTVAPFVVFEFVCEKVYRFSEFINTAHNQSPKWLTKFINWSESNDKHETK